MTQLSVLPKQTLFCECWLLFFGLIPLQLGTYGSLGLAMTSYLRRFPSPPLSLLLLSIFCCSKAGVHDPVHIPVHYTYRVIVVWDVDFCHREATASENRLSPKKGMWMGRRPSQGSYKNWRQAWVKVFLTVSLDKQAGQGAVHGSFVWIMWVASRLQTLTSCLWFGLGDLGQGKYMLNMWEEALHCWPDGKHFDHQFVPAINRAQINLDQLPHFNSSKLGRAEKSFS